MNRILRQIYQLNPASLGDLQILPPDILEQILTSSIIEYTDLLTLWEQMALVHPGFAIYFRYLRHQDLFWDRLLFQNFHLHSSDLNSRIYMNPEMAYQSYSEGRLLSVDGSDYWVSEMMAQGLIYLSWISGYFIKWMRTSASTAIHGADGGGSRTWDHSLLEQSILQKMVPYTIVFEKVNEEEHLVSYYLEIQISSYTYWIASFPDVNTARTFHQLMEHRLDGKSHYRWVILPTQESNLRYALIPVPEIFASYLIYLLRAHEIPIVEN